MTNLNQINKQFYKYWKKVSMEWRPVFFIALKRFHALKKLSKATNKEVHKLILSLLEQKIEFIDDKELVEDALELNLTYEQYRAIMQFAGYYFYKHLDAYDINYERVKCVMNACDAAESFARKWNRYETYGRINAFRIQHYQKKMDQYSRKVQKIALYEDSTAFRVEPANGERFRFVNQLLNKFLLIAVVICFTVLIVHAGNLKSGDAAATDPVNVSFWSSLVGACIPGICTILTTYLLIHHEYKVDYHKERMSSLPVFSLIHVANKQRYINEIGGWDENRNPLELFENTAENDTLSDKEVDLYILRNRGDGNAFNVSHNRGDDVFSFGDIPSNEEKVIALRKYDSLYYVISFMDIYGNKYTQRFDIDAGLGRYNITTFPPELVFRTKLVRYQQ